MDVHRWNKMAEKFQDIRCVTVYAVSRTEERTDHMVYQGLTSDDLPYALDLHLSYARFVHEISCEGSSYSIFVLHGKKFNCYSTVF